MMRIKEADRTANVAWSPANVHPIYLAAGTAAQQLDASFSTTSCLEIYDLNVQEPGLDMTIKGCIETDHRFHKVSWGAFGMNRQETSSGVIVGGCDGGNMFLYNPARILNGSTNEGALLFHKDKHTGPVSALSFNVFQENLLASGASDSEILIWDLNDPSNPMTPGTKSQPADDVTCIAWNCQVQHILASTFGTRCVVWDLRKNEPIIKVSGSTSRMRCKVVAWHPNIATQMCLASEDDHTPFIQLWDLRFATSPLKTLEHHQSGVLSLAWCPQDPDLLLSCGKDCRILCWNPNSNVAGGEVVCEIPTSNQWSFEVGWCPRNPTLISSSSFDGHVSIYSLMGGVQQVRPSAKVTEAFMDANNYTMQQAPEFTQTTSTYCLNKPPKWFRRPVGASFGFGGKLVTFDNERNHQPAQVNQTTNTEVISSSVYISQVVTEPDLVQKASQLEDVLNNGQFADFCRVKIDSSSSTQQQEVWRFLQAHFDDDPKAKLLSLLGHTSTENETFGKDDDCLQKQTSSIRSGGSPTTVFDQISADSATSFSIPTSSDTAGLVSKLLLAGNLDAAVEMCLRKDLLVEAILLSIAGGNDLVAKTRQKYFEMKSGDSLTQLIAAVVTRNWSQVVNSCDLNNWKEALAGALVYSSQQEFVSLCETLGRRLEGITEGRVHEAMLCYVCSTNVSKLVECWFQSTDDNLSPTALESIVEQVTVLKRAANDVKADNQLVNKDTSSVSNVLYRYSSILASQGKLSMALLHLEPSEEESIALLQNRLSRALNVQPSGTAVVQRPSFDGGQQQTRPVQLQQRQGHSLVQPNLHSSTVRPQRNESLPHMSKYPTAAMPQATSPPIQPYSRGLLNPSRYPQGYGDNQPSTTTYGQPSLNSFGNAAVADMNHHVMQTPIPAYGATPSMNAPLLYNPSSYEQSGGTYRSNNTPGPYQPQPPNPQQPETYGLIQNSLADTKPGWNDPPLISKSNQPRQEFEQPAPITHPLFGTTPETTSSGIYNPGVYPQQYHQQQHVPAEMANFGQQGVVPMQQPTQSLPTVAPARPQMTVKPKGPIPTEHQILHDLFEDLKCKCLAASTSMPMKRKLEEVNRKLEVLYDKLRENELTSNTTLGLHRVVQAIQQGDYQTALMIHAQMVSTGAFSEIGGFMPGLKVLLQTAQNLAIYIQ